MPKALQRLQSNSTCGGNSKLAPNLLFSKKIHRLRSRIT